MAVRVSYVTALSDRLVEALRGMFVLKGLLMFPVSCQAGVAGRASAIHI